MMWSRIRETNKSAIQVLRNRLFSRHCLFSSNDSSIDVFQDTDAYKIMISNVEFKDISQIMILKLDSKWSQMWILNYGFNYCF